MLQSGIQDSLMGMARHGFELLIQHDCEPEERLDSITRDAAAIFRVPIAMINLVDKNSIIFKSCVGLKQGVSINSCGAFCSTGVRQENCFAIVDALNHADYKDYSLVTGPLKIRSYVGKSIHAPDGTRIGTLCLFDTKPRKYTRVELHALRDLAEMVDYEIREMLPDTDSR
jgi:GAF domain-containing protein